MAEADISRVISLIMENPKLIEEIKNLASNEEHVEQQTKEEPAELPSPVAAEAVHRELQEPDSAKSRRPKRRTELLEALKPYISDERRKAVESFVTIAEILDMMREK